MDKRWLALLAPWGKGLEAGLVCVPGVTAEWPPKVMVVYPKHPGGMEQVPMRSGESLEVQLQLPRTPSPLPALTAASGERMREDFPGQLNVSALNPPVSTRMWHRPCLTAKKENCTLSIVLFCSLPGLSSEAQNKHAYPLLDPSFS
ncbi:uncharacterized protein LOC118919346 isoform X6 [Manis pentadactyla]|uniref:uncharacterized protein LOC118919346 isoform X6 n=1 Tax=Manis pentadactyla TaxID=143292 RepID=UPI00255C8D7B|nr:uncharacterized protein LOC118919346 isoform X6 [Manis pentadactyla]